MSHGDECTVLPMGFEVAAVSSQHGKDIIVGFRCPSKRVYGLQYHPEVTHSEKGAETLRRFFFDIAKLKGGYDMDAAFLDRYNLPKYITVHYCGYKYVFRKVIVTCRVL